ncbi:MAG: GyrI-like domain-containing protein [Anaerolineae bacterium]|nr:GyrI-like domain-containing protein [Anaerolineae bacterium]
MSEQIEVRMVRLESMRVASAHGFGTEPENEAWRKILAWAREQGLSDEVQPGRFFGFNNPSPSPGSPNYGYEQWLVLTPGDAVNETGDVTIKTFDGGLYAVARCKLPQIGEVWKQLNAWRETSAYKNGHHQWLEEARTPYGTAFEDIAMDLYLPVTE